MQHYRVISVPEMNAAGGVRSSVSPALRFFEIRYHKEQRGIFSCAPMCTRAKLRDHIFEAIYLYSQKVLILSHYVTNNLLLITFFV